MTWEALNLASAEYAADPEPPATELHGLLYRRKRHVVSGASEAAKTLIVWALALEGQRAGIRVACVDFEMGPTATRRLLVDLGATDDELAAFTYYEPTTAPTPTDIDQLAETADLVIIDAAAGAYDVSGLDDNKRQDAEKFARAWITPLWQRRVATVLIDHVVKNADNRGRYPIGSERKLGGCDVHLGIEAKTTLTRGGSGLVTVRVHKDRPGFLSRPITASVVLESDPVTHRITWTMQPESNDDGFRPTVLMDRVSRYAEDRGTVTRTAIYYDVTGKRSGLVTAVDCLVRDGYLDDDGSRLRSLNPYRDGSLGSPGSQAVPAPFPDPGSTSVPPVPTPYGGNGEPGNYDENEIARLEAIAAELQAAGELP